jgi:transposase
VNRRGWPISWEVFPGNTADAKAFEKTIAKFRERFKIGRVSIVADRGMISKDAISLLTDDEQSPYDYILGCRLRQSKEVREEVLSRAGRYQEVSKNLKVKEVLVSGRRYVVCKNDDEAVRDAAARESLVGRLREKLSAGQAKSLVGNIGYRRFLKGAKSSWLINEEAVKNDARFDGVFVLRTNMELPAAEIATTYKGLWRVERTFREEKSTLEVRPLFHHQDDTRIGHIVASFLALRLEVDLQRRLEEKGGDAPWPNLMRDLSQVQAVHLDLDGMSYIVRTDLAGFAFDGFRAAGVRIPNRVTSAN